MRSSDYQIIGYPFAPKQTLFSRRLLQDFLALHLLKHLNHLIICPVILTALVFALHLFLINLPGIIRVKALATLDRILLLIRIDQLSLSPQHHLYYFGLLISILGYQFCQI